MAKRGLLAAAIVAFASCSSPPPTAEPRSTTTTGPQAAAVEPYPTGQLIPTTDGSSWVLTSVGLARLTPNLDAVTEWIPGDFHDLTADPDELLAVDATTLHRFDRETGSALGTVELPALYAAPEAVLAEIAAAPGSIFVARTVVGIDRSATSLVVADDRGEIARTYGDEDLLAKGARGTSDLAATGGAALLASSSGGTSLLVTAGEVVQVDGACTAASAPDAADVVVGCDDHLRIGTDDPTEVPGTYLGRLGGGFVLDHGGDRSVATLVDGAVVTTALAPDGVRIDCAPNAFFVLAGGDLCADVPGVDGFTLAGAARVLDSATSAVADLPIVPVVPLGTTAGLVWYDDPGHSVELASDSRRIDLDDGAGHGATILDADDEGVWYLDSPSSTLFRQAWDSPRAQAVVRSEGPPLQLLGLGREVLVVGEFGDLAAADTDTDVEGTDDLPPGAIRAVVERVRVVRRSDGLVIAVPPVDEAQSYPLVYEDGDVVYLMGFGPDGPQGQRVDVPGGVVAGPASSAPQRAEIGGVYFHDAAVGIDIGPSFDATFGWDATDTATGEIRWSVDTALGLGHPGPPLQGQALFGAIVWLGPTGEPVGLLDMTDGGVIPIERCLGSVLAGVGATLVEMCPLDGELRTYDQGGGLVDTQPLPFTLDLPPTPR